MKNEIVKQKSKKNAKLPPVERLIEIEKSIKTGRVIECANDIELYCLNLAKKIPLKDILEDRDVYVKSWFAIDEIQYTRRLMKKYCCTEKEIFNRFNIANAIRKYNEKKIDIVFKEQKRMIKVIKKHKK